MHPMPSDGRLPAKRTGRPPGADKDVPLDIGRRAVAQHGKATRQVVEKAVRAEDLSIGGQRLTQIMTVLRAEFPADNSSDETG